MKAALGKVQLDKDVLWRAALVQLLAVVVLSLLLAALLSHSFFEDWGWIAGPAAWFACAAVTAWALHLHMRGVLLGALLAGLVSAIAVVLGIHWLGLVIAIAAFAAWCAWLPSAGSALPWLGGRKNASKTGPSRKKPAAPKKPAAGGSGAKA